MPFELTTYEAYDFANSRHIGPSPLEMTEMLNIIGFCSLDALIDDDDECVGISKGWIFEDRWFPPSRATGVPPRLAATVVSSMCRVCEESLTTD